MNTQIIPQKQELATVRMLEKATTLHQDGYRAELIFDDLYRITGPNGQQYVVDVRDHTCECQAFRSGQFRDSKGRKCCKHTVGTRSLVSDQCREAAREAFVQLCYDRVAHREGWTDKVPQEVRK
jgi:hypothetical protein